jgi:hypothetical protein
MTTFTVWKFDSPDGAEQAASVLKVAAKGLYAANLGRQVLIRVSG